MTLQVDARLKEKDAEKQATQTELDDLLMVFSDLEDKVARYKVSLVMPPEERRVPRRPGLTAATRARRDWRRWGSRYPTKKAETTRTTANRKATKQIKRMSVERPRHHGQPRPVKGEFCEQMVGCEVNRGHGALEATFVPGSVYNLRYSMYQPQRTVFLLVGVPYFST